MEANRRPAIARRGGLRRILLARPMPPGSVALLVLTLLAGTAFLVHLHSAGLPAIFRATRPPVKKLPASIVRPPRDVNALAFHNGVLWAGGMEGVAGLDPVSGAPLKVLPAASTSSSSAPCWLLPMVPYGSATPTA